MLEWESPAGLSSESFFYLIFSFEIPTFEVQFAPKQRKNLKRECANWTIKIWIFYIFLAFKTSEPYAKICVCCWPRHCSVLRMSFRFLSFIKALLINISKSFCSCRLLTRFSISFFLFYFFLSDILPNTSNFYYSSLNVFQIVSSVPCQPTLTVLSSHYQFSM